LRTARPSSYEDLQPLYAEIGKPYPIALYELQFAFYVDNILARIDLREEAYSKTGDVPSKLFEVYEEQRARLQALRDRYGPLVSVDHLIEAQASSLHPLSSQPPATPARRHRSRSRRPPCCTTRPRMLECARWARFLLERDR
jgi:phosphoenolpyruvate carboxykinase (GTP)